MDILRRKLANLVRGEEGVALVVTLALFMFLYVSSAGVFAVGRFVKDKIALQNAVDAAAYSAAVVEADTLSKIATINRAMTWRYQSLVCNQMDYVTRKWLQKTLELYDSTPASVRAAEQNELLNGTILLNEKRVYVADIRNELAVNLEEDIIKRIETDRQLLDEMNAELENLKGKLKDCVDSVVEGILEANLPLDMLNKLCFYKNTPCSPSSWLKILGDESRFMEFSSQKYENVLQKYFNDEWFPAISSDSSDGIKRGYIAKKEDLLAQWEWKMIMPPEWSPIPGRCDAADYYNELFPNGNPVDEYINRGSVAVGAKPQVLAKEYFNDNSGIARGAITVAVAMKARNPWRDLINWSSEDNGFYEAFSPMNPEKAKWVYALASAQAGYRPFRIDDSTNGTEKQPLAYSLIYDETENLRTDDWDAVFVPVRRAMTGEEFETFMTQESDWKPVSSLVSSDPDGNDYRVDDDFLPRMHNSGNTMSHLDWENLQKKIYH